MKYLKDYIQESISQGNYFVTKEQVLVSLDISPEKFRFQAYRLILKKAIRPLTRDFFMIIPPEYKNLGGVPPHWVIDPLMKHLNQDYYVALLTAASMYGATNQQPMCFQVITTKPHSTIELERGSIRFHVFKQCSMSVKEKISSPAGYSIISSKEQTLLDLVRFNESCGYLSNVALVIQELTEKINKKEFQKILSHEKNNSVLQRLGFILYYIGLKDIAKIVEKELSKRKIQFILLVPHLHNKSSIRNEQFKMIVNDTIEVEE